MIRQFLKYFKVPFIIILVLTVLYLGVRLASKPSSHLNFDYYESTNDDRVYGDQRVFDGGNQMTEEDEAWLEEYINEAEKKTTLDIVVFTLEESLVNFAPYDNAKSNDVTIDKKVMLVADSVWENYGFGYDCAQVRDGSTDTGDGVILVDNTYREFNGKIYTWMGTTGKAEEMYSSDMIDRALDSFYYKIPDEDLKKSDFEKYSKEYREACKAFVDHIVEDVKEIQYKQNYKFSLFKNSGFAIFCSVIFMIIYYFKHKGESKGKNTVKNTTYLESGKPIFDVKEDRFIRKTVTKRYDPPNKSSSSGGGGGGGHHISGGGGSHGGGGHSR